MTSVAIRRLPMPSSPMPYCNPAHQRSCALTTDFFIQWFVSIV